MRSVYNSGVIQAHSQANAVLLPVKVVAGAARTRYLGEFDRRAKIAVAAPPEKGKANKTLLAYMAKLLGVRSGDVSIVAGPTSPLKTLRIENMSVAAVLAALQRPRS